MSCFWSGEEKGNVDSAEGFVAALPVEGSPGPGAGPRWRADAQSGPLHSHPHAALLKHWRPALTGAGSDGALGRGNCDHTRSGGASSLTNRLHMQCWCGWAPFIWELRGHSFRSQSWKGPMQQELSFAKHANTTNYDASGGTQSTLAWKWDLFNIFVLFPRRSNPLAALLETPRIKVKSSAQPHSKHGAGEFDGGGSSVSRRSFWNHIS